MQSAHHLRTFVIVVAVLVISTFFGVTYHFTFRSIDNTEFAAMTNIILTAALALTTIYYAIRTNAMVVEMQFNRKVSQLPIVVKDLQIEAKNEYYRGIEGARSQPSDSDWKADIKAIQDLVHSIHDVRCFSLFKVYHEGPHSGERSFFTHITSLEELLKYGDWGPIGQNRAEIKIISSQYDKIGGMPEYIKEQLNPSQQKFEAYLTDSKDECENSLEVPLWYLTIKLNNIVNTGSSPSFNTEVTIRINGNLVGRLEIGTLLPGSQYLYQISRKIVVPVVQDGNLFIELNTQYKNVYRVTFNSLSQYEGRFTKLGPGPFDCSLTNLKEDISFK